MQETWNTINTCTIIGQVNVDGERTVLGDSMQKIFDMQDKVTEPAPRGAYLNTEFLKKGEGFIVIQDIDRMFTQKEGATNKNVEDGFSVYV